jgi:hypothetical protein
MLPLIFAGECFGFTVYICTRAGKRIVLHMGKVLYFSFQLISSCLESYISGDIDPLY